jgi:hypothetical protein
MEQSGRNRRMVRRGSTVRVRQSGAVGLRACITNHRTTDDDVRAVVEVVLAAAEETS